MERRCRSKAIGNTSGRAAVNAGARAVQCSRFNHGCDAQMQRAPARGAPVGERAEPPLRTLTCTLRRRGAAALTGARRIAGLLATTLRLHSMIAFTAR
jgi:hypothetical protein